MPRPVDLVVFLMTDTVASGTSQCFKEIKALLLQHSCSSITSPPVMNIIFPVYGYVYGEIPRLA